MLEMPFSDLTLSSRRNKMNFSVIQHGDDREYILLEKSDGTFECFEKSDDNPRYQQWIAEGHTPEETP
jgi:hypothetical protein